MKLRILQIVAPDASAYERKCLRIDSATPSEKFVLVADAPDLVHVYGSPPPLALPYIASAAPAKSWFRRSSPPRLVVTPFNLPEAVEEAFFREAPRLDGWSGAPHLIASFVGSRPGVQNQVEQTMARIHRFRDDIAWRTFDTPPAPDDLREVDVWVDPAIEDGDFDGFTAEAIVAGKRVVAARTPINEHRLEKGRTGFLVPRKDPNELTHAILEALFKSEVARLKIDAARQTVGKFRPRQRLRVLERVYQATVT
ncbi:MAG TPA: glycosyltransferase [Thermoanaerobaculia bacterium]|nr:glycosyltransferase [Thermoanaerobaculia bacterium]